MPSRVFAAALSGIEGYLVEVEADVSSGLPAVIVVGLPDEAVKESRERVKTALKNSGFVFPAKRVTINLAPADIKKEGPSFDLPIALGILAAQGIVPSERLEDVIVQGELSLDGRLRPVSGVLPIAILARQKKMQLCIPAQNVREASAVGGIDIYGIDALTDLVAFLRGDVHLEPFKGRPQAVSETEPYLIDMAEISGQQFARRALEVAVSGGHNVLLVGPPGTGKTMLAMRVPTILPPLSYEEALETSKIHSIVGNLSNENSFVTTRPFRAPHHSISFAGLVGGGTFPRPGEVSLAHNGVLFLDELPEFKRSVLEAMRQPLEDRCVTISRASGSLAFPAGFMLIASMNPCPCGYASDPRRKCTCSPVQVSRYLARISGPLLDRIDIHIEVPALEAAELLAEHGAESSAKVRERVLKARKIQSERLSGQNVYCNAQLREKHLKDHCRLDEGCKKLVKMAITSMGLSPRAYGRIRKVARTIADLDGGGAIREEHLAEAIQYRALQQKAI